MLHSNVQTNFIGAQESVYRDSPTGNLETISLVGTMPPLQQGFYSDGKTCFSVAVHDLSAFAFKQRVVGAVPVPNSTAVRTPFTRMPTINCVQNNIIVKAPLFKNAFELGEWNAHDCSVESLALRFELEKILDRDVSIKPFGENDNFTDYLSEVGFDEIPFLASQPGKLLSGLDGLEFGTAFHNLFSSCPDVFSEVCLVKNFSSRRDNGNSKMFRVNVDSKNILSLLNFFFFGKVSNNQSVGQKSVSLASPAVSKKRRKPLPIPVFFNRDCNSLARSYSKFDKKVRLSGKSLTIAGDVKLDADASHFIGLLAPSVSNERTDDLNIKRGVGFAC